MSDMERLIEDARIESPERAHNASDRGMDLTTWLEWIADTIIEMHDNGCSDNQARFWFCSEFDRRYGNGEAK